MTGGDTDSLGEPVKKITEDLGRYVGPVGSNERCQDLTLRRVLDVCDRQFTAATISECPPEDLELGDAHPPARNPQYLVP